MIRDNIQSAGTVPYCIPLVLPVTRSTKKSHVAAIKVYSLRQTIRPKRLILSTTTNSRLLWKRFPTSNSCSYF